VLFRSAIQCVNPNAGASSNMGNVIVDQNVFNNCSGSSGSVIAISHGGVFTLVLPSASVFNNFFSRCTSPIMNIDPLTSVVAQQFIGPNYTVPSGPTAPLALLAASVCQGQSQSAISSALPGIESQNLFNTAIAQAKYKPSRY